jgi:hypothetical protein
MLGFWRKKLKSVTLETQLQSLAARGISVRPGRTIDELLISFPREEYESDPFRLLLFMLGGEVEDGEAQGSYFTDNVYCFDAESIEDTCDYKFKVERLVKIAAPDLPIQNVTDAIDLEAATAHIEFELDGRTHHIEPTINDDWFDPEVLYYLARLLAARSGERRFFHCDTGDQNIVIACLTPAQSKALAKATGLEFTQLG